MTEIREGTGGVRLSVFSRMEESSIAILADQYSHYLLSAGIGGEVVRLPSPADQHQFVSAASEGSGSYLDLMIGLAADDEVASRQLALASTSNRVRLLLERPGVMLDHPFHGLGSSERDMPPTIYSLDPQLDRPHLGDRTRLIRLPVLVDHRICSEAASRSLNLDRAGDPTALYLGRDSARKQVGRLLDAWCSFERAPEMPSLNLLGPERMPSMGGPRLEIHDDARIRLLGSVSDPLKRADALLSTTISVHPSRLDLKPQALAEALVTACIPIATTIPAHVSMVPGGNDYKYLMGVGLAGLGEKVEAALCEGVEFRAMIHRFGMYRHGPAAAEVFIREMVAWSFT